ncbi:hypothetical protein [Devosia psychrophila]|jgi:hypothetical protein|uniref:Uncharacterized protein n=1 Tax=Devosia psychrophila TaxID=728005 RepID=A0A0F5PUH4_9HYPH|nr:hypothetical protein [Devosia psychrophila]KKC32283.1 hypothetical protein WH91_14930 [Devosia psychrophila]SFD09140.1 hypothetical protein SAMN04488059_12069 [Devosia psychrophila]
MSTKPHLSQRAIVAYNRFSKDVAALNYVRHVKPGGPLGSSTVALCNRLVTLANRLFGHEPGLQRFSRIDPVTPMTQSDLVLFTARLTAASTAFEERYFHLTESGIASNRDNIFALGKASR